MLHISRSGGNGSVIQHIFLIMDYYIRTVILYLAVLSCGATSSWRRKYYNKWDWDDYEVKTRESVEWSDIPPPASYEDVYKPVKVNHPGSPIAGLDAVRPIRTETCTPEVLRLNKELSSPIDCARTCQYGEKPKTCYYHFVVERYPINGKACQYCTPNATNTHCPNCQCVPGDGVERMALTVNRMIPGPSIEVCLGDYVVVDVENQLKGSGISIHWHGVFQKGYQYYDGVPYLTQCPIPDSTTFRYQWAATNAGTHFWHAHTGLHKMDGIFGSLVIRQPPVVDQHSSRYNYDLSEHVIVINDWMHEEATARFPGRNERSPVSQLPESVLINGKGRYTNRTSGEETDTPLEVFTVRPNRRYRFRLVNAFCTVCPSQITIQNHNLTVIETDGQAINPVVVDSIISFAGERYDFILNTNQEPGTYWIQVRAIGVCKSDSVQQIAVLQYHGGYDSPHTASPTYDEGLPRGVVLNPLDGVCNRPRKDAICISNLRSANQIDAEILKAEPDYKFYLPIRFYEYPATTVFNPEKYNGFIVQRSNLTATSLVDGITFTFPPSPPLSQPNDLTRDQFCNSRNLPRSCVGSNCKCTHMVEVPLNAIVEFVLIDEFQATDILHPFHLHGHSFYVLSMGQPFNENVTRVNENVNDNDPNCEECQTKRRKINLEYAKELDRKNKLKRLFESPPAKDTVPIPNNGLVVVRFRANNPGFWLFHCHFIYHQMVGMELILRVGQHSDLPPVPNDFPKCGNFRPPISQDRPTVPPYGYQYFPFS